ncbi:MAG: hypothetical protein AAFZ07_16085 [Actinomycetota bacterium]
MTASLAAPQDLERFLDREWERLSAAGTWWSGAERVAIAAAARAARDGDPRPGGLDDAPVEAAERLSVAAHHVTGPWLDDLEERGLDRLAYVELLGVVSRVRAVDTALFGLGRPERPLPVPAPGEPSGRRVDGAGIDGGLVPTVGRAGPPNALSAVDDEDEALHDLHGAMYLSLEQMRDLHIERGLGRAQMELVAARTSLLNDCFF